MKNRCNTTVEDSIMRLDGVDEDTAKKKAEQIKKENSVAMPSSKLSAPFGPNAGADLGGKTNMDGKSMMDTNPADAGKGATK